MSRAEVKAVSSCQPYKDYTTNPDFECPNLDVDGKTRNVSFHFDAEDHLTIVQLWYAELASLPEAVEAVLDVEDHFRRHLGSQIPPNATETAESSLRTLRPYPARLLLRPSGNTPKEVEVWSVTWLMPQAGYEVMVYYGSPPATPAWVRATDRK